MFVQLSPMKGGPSRLMRQRTITEAAEQIPTPPHRFDIGDNDISSDGERIVYWLGGDQDATTGTWWISGLDGTNPAELPSKVQEAGCLRWFQHSHRLLVSVLGDDSKPATFGTYDTDSGRFVPVPYKRSDLSPQCATPTPDGRHMVFTAGEGSDQIWQSDLSGEHAKLLWKLPTGCISNLPSVSPDGRYVATGVICETGYQDRNSVWILPRGSGLVRQVAVQDLPEATGNASYQYWMPRWTGDSGSVVYYRFRPGAAAPSVFEASIRGGEPVEIVSPKSVWPVPVP